MPPSPSRSGIIGGKPPATGGFSASDDAKNPFLLLDIAKTLC